MKRIVVGMSGGVDSAVSALLLKQQGHDVIGVYMNNWEDTAEDGVCTSEQDWADVRRCCELIGIPYYAVSFSQEYTDRVFAHFLREYERGRTPNPDVLCNREIKFKAFLEFALQLDADQIATGHFARTNERGALLRGADTSKDQSYFLYMLKGAQLKKTQFPVGGMTKRQVRAIAAAHRLPVSSKKDSTGICFIGERRFRDFLQTYLPAKPGLIRSSEGEILGEHQGLMYYTIGQRRGMGIGGRGNGGGFFVVDKDLANNELIVVQGADHPLLYSRAATLEDITWVNEPPGKAGEQVALTAKFRYRQADQSVRLSWSPEESTVVFDTPQRAVTPGQSAVFYRDEECLGGGIITAVTR